MKCKARYLLPALGLLALFLFPSFIECQKKDEKKGEYQITFTFIHKVGKDPLIIDTIRYQNRFGNKYSVATLKYFISSIMLIESSGDSMVVTEAHLIDISNNKTTSFLSDKKAPAGSYTQISFILGLDRNTNVTGRFPNYPENRMEWPETMGGGYHYMKLEGKIDSAGDIRNYQAHTGQLNGIPYFIHIVLPASHFTIANNGVTVQIIMNINEWWNKPNILDLNDVTAIMDNSLVQKQLMENGSNIFSLGSIY